MTRPQDAATEALAASDAAYWKALPAFKDDDLIRASAMEWARWVRRALKRRGYVIRKARKSG